MLQYIDNVIAQFVSSTRDIIGNDHDQAALAIFDHFSGQGDRKIGVLYLFRYCSSMLYRSATAS